MTNAITSLSTTVSADSLWAVFGECIPYLGTVIIVALGMFLVRRMIRGVSKAKARI